MQETTNRISQIIVNGLFGTYDYCIHIDSDILLVHGLNGCGKTTIMRLFRAVMSLDFSTIQDVIFRDFQLFFSNGSRIIVRKEIAEILKLDEEIGKFIQEDQKIGWEPGDGVRDLPGDQHPAIRNTTRKAQEEREARFVDQTAEFIIVTPTGFQKSWVVSLAHADALDSKTLTSSIESCAQGLRVHFISSGRLYCINGDEKSLFDATSYYVVALADMISMGMSSPRPLLLSKQNEMAEFGLSIDDVAHFEYTDSSTDADDDAYENARRGPGGQGRVEAADGGGQRGYRDDLPR